VTWPNCGGAGGFFRRGGGASGTARTSDDSGRSPIRLSMAQWPEGAVEPRGKPRTRRRWFSKLAGDSAFDSHSGRTVDARGHFVGKQHAAVFEKFDGEHRRRVRDSRTRGRRFPRRAGWGLEARAGARERRRMPLRWWFSTSG